MAERAKDLVPDITSVNFKKKEKKSKKKKVNDNNASFFDIAKVDTVELQYLEVIFKSQTLKF